MKERDKAAAYLRHIAEHWPSPRFQARHGLSPATITMGKAILRVAAVQIEKGEHLEFTKQKKSKG